MGVRCIGYGVEDLIGGAAQLLVDQVLVDVLYASDLIGLPQ